MHITAKQNIIKPAEKISYENLSASLQPPATEMFCDFQTVCLRVLRFLSSLSGFQPLLRINLVHKEKKNMFYFSLQPREQLPVQFEAYL